jgi:hypothetical protein
MNDLVSVIVGLAGVMIIVLTVASAAQTFVVPRGTPMLITRWVFLAVRAAFSVLLRRSRDYRTRDHAWAMFAPATLLALPVVWLALVLVGFTGVYHSIGVHPWQDAVLESGSSLFMLGFQRPPTLAAGFTEMIEAGIGLGLVALLISYLPSIYGSYSRREVLVTGLEAEAGSPPVAPELLARLIRIRGPALLDTYWTDWVRWFNDIEETHCSTPLLAFFRSPAPERSWVTAAGAILDSASLAASTMEPQSDHSGAELCVRAGNVALRRVGDYFAMPCNPDPQAGDPITVTRGEFDDACGRLAGAGADLKLDRDQAWREFVLRRASYEESLLRFASLCMAPWAPWSSDRAIPFHRLPATRRRARSRPRLRGFRTPPGGARPTAQPGN